MNRSLFYSRIHLPLAAVTVAVLLVWLYALGAPPGAREDSNRSFVLWSGWGSFATMSICLLYVPRKYFYRIRARLGTLGDVLVGTREGRWVFAAIDFLTFRKLLTKRRRTGVNTGRRMVLAGTSFESGQVERTRELRDKYLRLEEAEGQLARVRAEIARGFLTSRREVKKRIATVLKTHKVETLVRLDLRAGRADRKEPRFVFKLHPREPLGRMSHWLHSHFFYGLAFAVFVILHGGGTLTSPMGVLLNGLSLIVIVTGILGIILFAFGPARFAQAERAGRIGFEQSFALKAHAKAKIAEIQAEDRLFEAARKFRDDPHREEVCEQWVAASRDEVTRGFVSKKEKNDVARDLAKQTRVVSFSSGVLTVDVDKAHTLSEVPPIAFDRMLQTMRSTRILRSIRTIRFCENLSKRLLDDSALATRRRDLEILRTQYLRYRGRNRRLAWLRFWLNSWRAVHIPASILLMALVILHILSVWWY